MEGEPFTVRPDLLREVARALGDDAYRLARGLAGVPGLVPPAAGWRTATALAELEAAVHAWCGALGARVAATAGALATAADGYQAVDERVARRLTALPR
ncbi:type VII secretion target [Micromonospora olivasterospora]|uniref:Excreted virulence factor EspC (Type VII ESX diderm) n=1 Tax=Micromonospora olivasterospora TaxID=1880 RepID=A0A562I6B1_MICOL|nr:type VII secretion target [Micromonospora olivasterospora]TWH66557.1 excreted virulence factor EspC (type VII ESX diderm) [Micromonospora olivasterospora]